MKQSQIEIVNACAVLFSPDIEVTDRYLSDLTIEALKSAYRNKVFETHPDRAVQTGMDKELLSCRFNEVNRAYNLLKEAFPVIKKTGSEEFHNKRKAHDCTRQKKTMKTGSSKPSDASRHMPERRLLFGQYLFYCGVINLKSLMDAVCWQSKQRPLFGEIALEWKILTRKQVSILLRNKRLYERFGECGRRLDLITPFQHRAILARQSNSHSRIGKYFTDRGILSEDTLAAYYNMNLMHNRKFSG